MGKKLVTGAAGFLGSNLTCRLVEEGHEVIAFDYYKKEHPFLEEKGIPVFHGDVLNKDTLYAAMKGCDEVYHTAGLISYCKRDRHKMTALHIDGTSNVMDIAKEFNVPRVVHTSSTAAIGFSWECKPQDETNPWISRHNNVGYMETKRMGEEVALSHNGDKLEVVVVNPASFFGAGDINMNEGELVRNIKTGRLKKAFPGGMSVVSVKDTVEGHLLAMKRGKPGERYIISNGYKPMLELFNIIAEKLGKPKIDSTWSKSMIYVFYPAAFCMEKISDLINKPTKLTPQAAALGFGFRWYESRKARKELGWEPKQDFRESIKEAINFYKKHNLL